MKEVGRAEQASRKLVCCIELVRKELGRIGRIHSLGEDLALSPPSSVVWFERKTVIPPSRRYQIQGIVQPREENEAHPIKSCNIVSCILLEYIDDFFSSRSLANSAEFNTIIDWPATLRWIMSESMCRRLCETANNSDGFKPEIYRIDGTTLRRSTSLDR